MRFYNVSDRYITYLKGFDPKVPDNYEGKRPYVGVVITVNGHDYLAPLTSYKPKQDTYDGSSPINFKVYEKGDLDKKLGLIHVNNMIPVIKAELTDVNFSNQEPRYKALLKKQHAYILAEQDSLKNKAKAVHKLVTNDKEEYFVQHCCDFETLEVNYKNFQP